MRIGKCIHSGGDNRKKQASRYFLLAIIWLDVGSFVMVLFDNSNACLQTVCPQKIKEQDALRGRVPELRSTLGGVKP